VELHYGRDDFADRRELAERLGRDRSKDMATDYASGREAETAPNPAQAFAERRGITVSERIVEMVRKAVPEKLRGAFDDLVSPGERTGSEKTGPEPTRQPEAEKPRGRFDGMRLARLRSNRRLHHHRRAGGLMG
jgi:hypothetical protein